MSIRRKPSAKRLRIESLEARVLLSITASELDALEDDPNDQISEAWILTPGTAQAGTIDPGTDVDMFRFSVVDGQRVSIDVDNAPGSSLDAWMRLFDSSGNQFDVSDDDVGPEPEYSTHEPYLEYTFDRAGDYYVGISAYGNSGYDPVSGANDSSGGTGEYTITVTTATSSQSFMLYDRWNGTWHDAEEDHYGDEYLCWAGTASNTLAWTGWGNVPGMGGGDADIIFDYYEDHWKDDGGWALHGWAWWFSGIDYSPEQNCDVPGGGFHTDVEWSDYAYYNNYETGGGWNEAIAAIDVHLHRGRAVGISLIGPSSRHSITCWGFDSDPNDPEYYTAIWVTDSDDNEVALKRYGVEKDGDRWELTDGPYSGWPIYSISALTLQGSANTSMDEIGVHRPMGNAGYFIQDPNGNGYWDGDDQFYEFGYAGDTPIVGDWNGDGYDEIGVHRAVGNAGYFIQDYNGNGYWDGGDRFFEFGYADDTPIVGDWNGDGYDEIGVHRGVGDAGYFIQDYNGNGTWDGGDRFFQFGYAWDTPIVGNWNVRIGDEIGVHRAMGNAGYFIQDYNGNGYWDGNDRFFEFGYGDDTPIIGDWNGDGEDQIGVHRGVGDTGYFIQEYNGNGSWDSGDRYFQFGYAWDTPILGNWYSSTLPGGGGEGGSGVDSASPSSAVLPLGQQAFEDRYRLSDLDSTSAEIVGNGDSNDQISEAWALSPGLTQAGNIDSDTDVDMFSFTASVDQKVTIDIDNAEGSYLDSWVRLFDSNGNELAYSDDDKGPFPERESRESYLKFTTDRAGTYYVGVSAYGNNGYDPVTGDNDGSGSTGLYSITLTFPSMLYDAWGGTWHDADKDYVDDTMLCWAGSASNALAWTGWGDVPGMNGGDTETIFQYYKDHWTDEGGMVGRAWGWWFNGTNFANVEIPGGGFHSDRNWLNYLFYNDYYDGSTAALPDLAQEVQDGHCIGVHIPNHWVTCWGYDYDPDAPEYFRGIWVTDTDDRQHGLARYGVENDGTRWVFTDGPYSGQAILGYDALSFYQTTSSEIGVHRPVGNAGYFIQDPNGNGYWDGGDRFFEFGYGDDTPIIGDWNGDGRDEIGVHRAVGNAGYFIQDYNGNGHWDGEDRFFEFGYATDTPIIGDWNADGKDEIGVHRAVGNAGYFIQDYNGNGYWDGEDRFFEFGYATDTPIIGSWEGTIGDEIGVHRAVGNAGYFILDYSRNGAWGSGDRFYVFGYGDDTPIIGDWNGDEEDQIGVHRGVGNAGYFIQDYNDSGGWDGGDRFFEFGYASDTPIIGDWSGSPLAAAEGEVVPTGDVTTLRTSDVESIATEALAAWSALPLPERITSSLASVEYVITDLPGAMLGLAEHSTIYLDYNAAGHGWFVDLTPAVDEEFERIGSGESLRALAPAASDAMDLLTVVSHELGHVLGLKDLAPLSESLMSATLEKGLRRRPGEAERDVVLAGYRTDH